jgi:secreted PhoX family phosphatase
MTIERRRFLQGSLGVAGGALLGGPFQGLVAPHALAGPRDNPAFRRLRPIPDLRDGKVRLHLPEGFSYRSFHDTETQAPVVLDDGTVLPGRHDGMGSFRAPNGNVLLVRNHELNNPGRPFGPGTPYDSQAPAGTTTVEVTPFGEVERAFTSLNGTMMNCSGGVMPWGSWITCEETINGPDVGPDFTRVSNVSLTKPHGYVFEVPKDGQSDRQPITAAGRFAHEAVSFDPQDGIVYLTEDNFGFPSGFYRYIPATNPMRTGRLDNDGRLQMLAVRGVPNAHLEAAQPQRATYDVDWVDIDDPSPSFPYTPGQTAPTSNDTALVYVGNQGREQGAAGFSRLEGQVYENNVVYFTSTQGGGAAETEFGPVSGGYGNGFGQVWAYHTRAQKLQLVYESPGPMTLELPDNITTSARGTLVLCEDSPGDNYLRGLSRGGQLWDIALNRLHSSSGAPRFGDEFAGSTFSPDGHTLFVNIQASLGLTFAIWGPWQRIGV